MIGFHCEAPNKLKIAFDDWLLRATSPWRERLSVQNVINGRIAWTILMEVSWLP